MALRVAQAMDQVTRPSWSNPFKVKHRPTCSTQICRPLLRPLFIRRQPCSRRHIPHLHHMIILSHTAHYLILFLYLRKSHYPRHQPAQIPYLLPLESRLTNPRYYLLFRTEVVDPLIIGLSTRVLLPHIDIYLRQLSFTGYLLT